MGIRKETLNMESEEGQEILPVSSHSQLFLSGEIVSAPKRGQIPQFLPR